MRIMSAVLLVLSAEPDVLLDHSGKGILHWPQETRIFDSANFFADDRFALLFHRSHVLHPLSPDSYP